VVASLWLGREGYFGLAQPDKVTFPAELRGVWGGDLAPVLDGLLVELSRSAGERQRNQTALDGSASACDIGWKARRWWPRASYTQWPGTRRTLSGSVSWPPPTRRGGIFAEAVQQFLRVVDGVVNINNQDGYRFFIDAEDDAVVPFEGAPIDNLLVADLVQFLVGCREGLQRLYRFKYCLTYLFCLSVGAAPDVVHLFP
jgi:hypothetical protein